MGRSLSVLPTLPARTITSTFTCCGAETAAKSTGQTAPTSFSASAPTARAALRGSRFGSLEVHSAATPFLRAAEIVVKGRRNCKEAFSWLLPLAEDLLPCRRVPATRKSFEVALNAAWQWKGYRLQAPSAGT